MWAAARPGGGRATGDYLFARAFSELAESGDADAVALLAGAALALARGEALQRRQVQPSGHVRGRVPAALLPEDREALRGGVHRSAASRVLGEFGLTLGVAFQIADDILDCTGAEGATGKAPGVDLRDGTPTLPLILAAREDPEVARALAGEDVPDALERVAATGALDASREVALEFAENARASLNGVGRSRFPRRHSPSWW